MMSLVFGRCLVWLAFRLRPVDGGALVLGSGATALDSTNFQEFVHNNEKVMVDFFDHTAPDWNGLHSELVTAVRSMRDNGCKVPVAKVDTTLEAELGRKYVPDGRYPQLVWFVHGEPTQYHRRLKSAETILNFVMAVDREPVLQVTSEKSLEDYSPAVLAKIQRNSPMYKALEVTASKHMDTVAVMYLDSHGASDNVSFITKEKMPQLYTGEATAESVDKWLRARLVKSEERPWHDLSPGSPLVTVVGSSFEEVVLNKEKDVFLMIFASWCGYSRKFFPVWESFARKITPLNFNAVVAQMDGDRNSSPLPQVFNWTAYPTVILCPAGASAPVVFSGNRTVENLVKWANKHIAEPLRLQDGETLSDSEDGGEEDL
eukprot:gnl/TRDRNA2_/TRDRNA2_131422_c0_seq1.p1 gnl/TRDRNA2_/TRDRNA2_131422_c0~~gnl/TRDRNA2_/TRDRNA2_131422_c0_seq1.p1  ORF type:complete len:374 (+),score=70.51 gnl/TRDRNA2_/TRDRNA2_131422_c0_seq1:91-1212(+)